MLSSKTSKQKALLALAWVCFFWGTTWIGSKVGVKYMPALQLCAIRQLLGGSVYVLYFLVTKHPWPKGRQWGIIIVLSFLNFMVANGLSTWGVHYISSGLGAIIGAIFPLWIVIVALFDGDRMPQKAVLGMVLGFGGVCIIFYDHLKDFLIPDFRFGIIISVIATISWAIGSVYTKKHAANFNPYFSLGLQMLISSAALFATQKAVTESSLAQSPNPYIAALKMIRFSDIPANAWWAILYLVVIGSVLTFIAYIYSLQRLPTSLASLYAYINPVVAVLLGAVIFNEKLNNYIAVGGAIAIAGVYLVNDSFKKKT